MNKGMIGLAAVLAAGGVAAQQPARTVQQDFVAAEALDAGTDKAAALAAWEALEKRTKAGSRSNAIVLVRKGGALFSLGRYDEAAGALRAGLAELPVADQTLREDRLLAYRALGDVLSGGLDYAGAAQAYTQMEAAAVAPGEKLAALNRLVEVQTFTNPAAADGTLTRAETLLAPSKADKPVLALFARRRALLRLNAGDFRGARSHAQRAVTLLGGLTQTVDLADVSARSDAAIAMLLGGDAEEARRYMAYTGAGRLPKTTFDPAAQMQAPDCGGEADLKLADVAVVEFSIAPDGTVSRAVPIYAAGGGDVALEFARAVRNWSWPAEQVQALPTFFRYNARVEMRCSTAFQRPSVSAGLDAALEQWLQAKGVAIPPEPAGSAAAALAGQRAALVAAEGRSPTSLDTLAAIHRLAANAVTTREERAALYARGAAIARANGAPAQVRLAMDLPARTSAIVDWREDGFSQAVTPMLAEPGYAQDPASRAAIRLMLADAVPPRRGRAARDAAATALLRQVADDKALASNDPLRVGALVRIASIEQQAGRADAAQAAFEASGLDPNQCAIMDAPPKLLTRAGAETFPMEALRWGFEGWTQVQYDVGADGKVLNQRPLLSYPPFIFSAAGAQFFGNARFAKTYRPDGGLGCGATTQRIKFMLPS